MLVSSLGEIEMPICPKCGAEVKAEDRFCGGCGTRLGETPSAQAKVEGPVEIEVKNIVIKRFEGIKNRDENVVRAVVDDQYSKFDDWSIPTRQEYGEALKNEFDAFKVLSSYNYEIRDFKVDVFGEVAVATFIIHYQGEIRNRSFDIVSRVTAILRKRESGWRILHEHLSRFSEQRQEQGQRRRGFPW